MPGYEHVYSNSTERALLNLGDVMLHLLELYNVIHMWQGSYSLLQMERHQACLESSTLTFLLLGNSALAIAVNNCPGVRGVVSILSLSEEHR